MATRCRYWTGLLALSLALIPGLAAAALPRAASLTLCADQYLLGLAAPEQIVAVSADARDPRQSLFAAEATAYPAHRGSSEELIALRAEVVLTDRWMPLQTAARLDRLGVRVVSIPLPNSWDDIANTTRSIAAALGRPQQGEARIAEMQARLAALAVKNAQRRGPEPLAAYFRPMAPALAAAPSSTPCCRLPGRAIRPRNWVCAAGSGWIWNGWSMSARICWCWAFSIRAARAGA